MNHNFIKFLATGFYVGNLSLMPGTFGSLLAYPLFIIVTSIALKINLLKNISLFSYYEQEIFSILTIQILFCVFLYIFGYYVVKSYLKKSKFSDPPEVVIDEIFGQYTTITLSFLCKIFAYESNNLKIWTNNQIELIFFFLIPFMFFRVFDILKPWPISWLDKNIKGAHGVMMDDFAAAFFASVFCYAFTFMII